MVFLFESLQPIISTDFPEDIFKPKPNKEAIYKYRVAGGQSIAKEKTVLFCGICRDVGHIIERNILRLNRIGKLFKDYKIYIYENDSSDNTVEILSKYKSEKLLFENGLRVDKDYREDLDNGVDPFHYQRCRILSECRNEYMNYVKNNSNFDYVCIVDLDILGGWSYDGVKHGIFTLEQDQKTACVSSYGVLTEASNNKSLEEMSSNQYLMYDSFAFRPTNLHEIHMFRLPAFNKLLFHRGDDPFSVISNFGGLAFYKMSNIIDKKYSATQHKEGYVDPDHVNINKQIINDGFSVLLDPSMITSFSHHKFSK